MERSNKIEKHKNAMFSGWVNDDRFQFFFVCEQFPTLYQQIVKASMKYSQTTEFFL